TAGAYAIYALGLRHVPASVAGIVTLTEPFTATLLGVLLFGERLGVTRVFGALLLCAALGLVLGPPDAFSGRLARYGPAGDLSIRPSLPWRFEQLDRVARRIVEKDLLSAETRDDIVAKAGSRLTQSLDLTGEILDLESDAVPATWLRSAPIWHGLSRSSSTGRRAQQEPEVAAREDDKARGRLALDAEAEMLGVKCTRRTDIVDDVTNADGCHVGSSWISVYAVNRCSESCSSV